MTILIARYSILRILGVLSVGWWSSYETPRFTLRELFLLVLIAAMGCGWWVEHRRSEKAQLEAIRLRPLQDGNNDTAWAMAILEFVDEKRFEALARRQRELRVSLNAKESPPSP
jgi:hypothetical protein